MDPLSVASSVVGLLAAAQKVSSFAGRIIASTKSGPREIGVLKTTVDTLRSLLLRIQLLFETEEDFDPKRASLIMAPDVVVTLTACVMTFSDIDACLKGLDFNKPWGLLHGTKWASKAALVKGIGRILMAIWPV